jgi:hypothetical protein
MIENRSGQTTLLLLFVALGLQARLTDGGGDASFRYQPSKLEVNLPHGGSCLKRSE